MEKIVLVGRHISYSLSPSILNHLFESFGLPYRYELCDISREELIPLIRQMKRGGYRGANVTTPYKQVVIGEMDEVSEEAGRIGAVNTIVFGDGRASGHNTDSAGFEWSLRDEPLIRSPFTAAVLGTGGAALAALFHLLRLDTLTAATLYSRDSKRADLLARGWNDPRLHGRKIGEFVAADLVIHATPVGLPASPGAILGRSQLEGVALLYEMIYAPEQTELARSAANAGARVMNGSRMLIGQAARSFELWTGLQISPEDIPSDVLSRLDSAR